MGSDHKYARANEHPEELDLWREWIRKNVKSGRMGFVFEDTDLIHTCTFDKDPKPWLVARRFWSSSDPIGKFMAIERKLGNADMDHAQKRTFGLWDHITRKGDPLRQRYMGWYLLNHPHEDPRKCPHVTINREKLTMDQFKLFLKFERDIPPYEFPDYVWKGARGG